MTSKREIKKYIDRLCGDVTQVVLPAAIYANAITEEEALEILDELSVIKAQAISRLNISFDKAPDAYATLRAWSADKKRYYRDAYTKVVNEFMDGVKKAIAPVNEAFAKK